MLFAKQGTVHNSSYNASRPLQFVNAEPGSHYPCSQDGNCFFYNTMNFQTPMLKMVFALLSSYFRRNNLMNLRLSTSGSGESTTITSSACFKWVWCTLVCETDIRICMRYIFPIIKHISGCQIFSIPIHFDEIQAFNYYKLLKLLHE